MADALKQCGGAVSNSRFNRVGGESMTKVEELPVGAPDPTPQEIERDAQEVAKLRSVLKSALSIKEEGNAAFGKGEYYRALELYDQGLKRLETLGETDEDKKAGLKAALHYNRSRAAYKIENFKLAAEAARACLKID